MKAACPFQMTQISVTVQGIATSKTVFLIVFTLFTERRNWTVSDPDVSNPRLHALDIRYRVLMLRDHWCEISARIKEMLGYHG
jgi:hypothetical protein